MDFYKDAPQRKRIHDAKKIAPPPPLDLTEPPLPCDASDGGCDCDPPIKPYKAWTRENPAIPIAEQDVISDNGPEIYSYLKQHGIKNLLVMGVHANMCILNRSFAIKQMTKWGIRCVLVRDLTDAMYNPKMKPFVSHQEGTEQIIEHIEKYWCPSVLSSRSGAEMSKRTEARAKDFVKSSLALRVRIPVVRGLSTIGLNTSREGWN